ncbi:MAG: NAD-dependent DNA ligase LigA, partial [Anaerotignum sp.]|nr:NAD-dependent DNA ligase LigA [Anaerotignum sp.]
GEALYCTNPNCSAQRIQALSHFVSRDAMNMEGLSEETLKKFLEKGFVENYPDLFRLEEHKDAITEMEGFGEKSYQNLIASIEKAKDVELPNFIYALGINHVGLRNAKLLCSNFGFDLEKIKAATEEELVQVEGFGEIIAHSIAQYFRQEEHLNLLADALGYLHIKAAEQAETGNSPLTGLTFVVTGDLEHFANRKELQALIEKGGGKVTGSVTKKTNFLINNDIHSASSKNKKAAELGIPILSEQDFIEKFMK